MNLMRFVSTVVVLVLCTTAPLIASKLPREIEKRGVVMWEDTSFDTAIHTLPYDRVQQMIRAVQDEPCELYFGRTILKNPKSGLIGVLTGALGVRVAMDTQVEPEEGGMDTAIFLQPADRSSWQRWIDYFTGADDSKGSRDLRMSLLLRRKARIQKFQMWLEDRTGKPVDAVTEADVAPLRDDPDYKWLSNDVFEPVTVVLKPELAKILWKNVMETGPAFGPLPTLNLMTPAEVPGAKVVQGCVVDDRGRFVVRRTDSMVLMSDLEKMFTIDGGIADDSLGNVVGHELFHGIMDDIMGVEAPGGPKSQSRVGHDAHVISDASMGFSEGWAIFFEAWTGEDNPTFDNRHGASKVSRFLLGRQVPIRRQLYTQAEFEKFHTTKKTGRIKNGSQMEATEGLVAGVLYSIMTHGAVADPFELMIEAMYRHKPQTMTQMVTALMACTPDQATRRIIALSYLYNTKFATVSVDAWAAYQDMYTAKLKFVRDKNYGVDQTEADALRRAYSDAREAYKSVTDRLAAQVLDGSLPLDANVGPELWMDGVVKKQDGKKVKEITYRFNLNTVTADFLSVIGLGDELADAIVGARDARGFVESEHDLAAAVPVEAIQLLSALRELYARGLADRDH